LIYLIFYYQKKKRKKETQKMQKLKPSSTDNNGTMPSGQPSNVKTANGEKRKRALLVVGTTGIIDSPHSKRKTPPSRPP
jgi:hypothetical protein